MKTDTSSKDLVMVDFAASDPRSVKAYLRGEAFAHQRHYDHLLEEMGDSDLDAVHKAHQATVMGVVRKNGLVKPSVTLPSRRKIAGAWISYFVQVAVGLTLGVMLYQSMKDLFPQ